MAGSIGQFDLPIIRAVTGFFTPAVELADTAAVQGRSGLRHTVPSEEQFSQKKNPNRRRAIPFALLKSPSRPSQKARKINVADL